MPFHATLFAQLLLYGTRTMNDDRPYRRGVGIILLDPDKRIWVGRRIDNNDEAWQMPQGGLDPGEEPWDCALRELEEETGIAAHLVERLAAYPKRLRYDLPEALRGELWKGKYVGQEQDWFIARFTGSDDDIDIATAHPEFSHWKWASPDDLVRLIVPFKRDLYRELLRHFADWL